VIDAASFADLPDAVRRALAAHRRVALVLLDAFGWRFVTRHADHPLLRRLDAGGQLRPLASQFPATTTAHVTTLHTGLPVGAHGLYEWRVWEPALGDVITPLLFSHAGRRERDTLAGTGLTMAEILPAEPTLYERLAGEGIASVVLGPAAFSPSTYDVAATRGARARPYRELRAGLDSMLAALGEHERCYAYLYFDGIDTTGHLEGPSSAAFDARVVAALDAVEAAFFGPGAAVPPDTLLVLTADHGQVDVHPSRVDALDRLWPELESTLQRDAHGRPVTPAGSARDVFLHVRPDRVEEAVGALNAALDGHGTAHATADLVAAGRFGEVGPRLAQRLAAVCVLPAAGRMAWLASAPDVEQVFLGHHGGVHPDEAASFVATHVFE
jgi:Type I phosphodiesterase / nucleotide pyrophosphatase